MKRTVLITGASRGIGKETARIFAQKGYDLVLLCHKLVYELEEFALELHQKYCVKVSTYGVNLGNIEQVKELFMVKMPLDKVADIDILINNAGISHMELFTELAVDELIEVLHVNLLGAMLCSQYVLPGMIRRKWGKIINISSVWGSVGASMEVVYSTSKAGLNGFTRSLAKEVAPSNVQVNGIACGMIDTDMNTFLEQGELESIVEGIPADRVGKPVEVAEFIHQIVTSPTYLTGQVIHFDGGWI